ncbi:hypothetical protein M0R89_14805 [Halorussus limi]|uniref:Uncharacterized protein n=1 Tax=Halorussus limi TaxID=2938695 RepID=A0A8U0HRS8_9EURY|nr:hypothetical protein [Halorussus limi]UPV73802.1 hypothetical protein M0R89_14805 [Halorussus limi]
MQNADRERTFLAAIRRRTSVAWVVGQSSARYFSRNVAEMGWRDRLFLPVVAVLLLALALLAPDLLSDDTFGELSPHAPVSV